MTFREAPRLETERLILRQFRKDDYRPYHAIVGDPEVMRYFGGVGMSAEDTWRRIASAAGSWVLIGMGGWAVESRDSGKMIGILSLFNAWRDLEPNFGEEPEMGWIIAKEVHGQGLASEACRAVLGWAEANLAPTPIWAIIAPENAPSIRVAEKLGFEPLQETTYRGSPTLVFKRPASGPRR